MLSRRFLRIKVMQTLYAFFHSEDKCVANHEKEMFSSFESIYDLHLYLLLLLIELRECGRNRIAIRRVKKLPTTEDITPNKKFIDNKIISIVSINKQVASESFKRKISWQNEGDVVQRLFLKITESDEYKSYMVNSESNFEEDKKFLAEIYKNVIAGDEALEMFFEEKNMYWADDIDFVNTLVLKTINEVTEYATDNFLIAPLYKDEREDKEYAKVLFRSVIECTEETSKMIRQKTENWELERIAFMDVLLMKMSIVEFLYFPTIPVKVSLNEYIELAKQYSTPKSSVFINGILDKLLAEFKKDGRLLKEGRGLIEN